MLIIFILTLLVSGCSSKSNSSADGNSDSGESTEEKVVEIKVGHVGAPVSPQQGAADIFVDLVNEKTNGSVKIKIYNSSQLGDERELVEGIQMGTVDGGIISSGLFASSYNVMAAFEVPFLFNDSEHALKVNTGEIGDNVLETLSSKGNLKALSIWDHGFRQITNSKHPIKEPKDLKDLKVRSPEVPSYSVALEALGATPIPMAFTELYVALDRGVVDGQHNPLMHVEGQRFFEVQKYMSVIDFAYTPNILAFSNKIWGELSEDQQKALNEAAKETAQLWSKQSAKESEELLNGLKDKMEVLTEEDVDRDAFVKVVVEEGYPQYQKEFGDEFVEFLKSVQKAGE